MKKLTVKTFWMLFALSLMICISAYVCIWFFLPYVDKKRAQHKLDEKTQRLISELRVTSKYASEKLFTDFIRNTGADIMLLNDKQQPVSLFTFEKIDAEIFEGNKYPFRFAYTTDEYILVIHYNDFRSGEIMGAIKNSIPFVGCIIIILSVVSALIFSRHATHPILRISQIADRIANLDFSWYCPDMRDDEIGILAESINTLSDKLHAALDELYNRNTLLEDEIMFEKERERKRMLFFSSVSHELKTPIAVVIGQLEGMQAEIGVYKDREKYLARSAEILQSLNRFIKEILLVSHIDMKEQSANIPVNLSEIIENLIIDYKEYAELSSICITKNIEENVCVCGDAALLKKAVGNVIENAVTHSPENGTVSVSFVRNAGQPKLTVTNFPAHIEDKDLPHLFEAFYRANQSVKHGSGLGLYITKIILETYNTFHDIKNVDNGVQFTAKFWEAPK